MLHSFRFKNLFSFLEETEVSFVVGKQAPDTDLFSKSGDIRISKLMAILGANGSGKTNLLKPLAFLSWFTTSSFSTLNPDEEIPIASHFFSESDDSELGLVFEIDGRIYKYELVLNSKQVIKEALFLKTSSLFSYLFRREWDERRGVYSIRQQRFGLLQREAQKVRKNASLISTAAQYNVDCAHSIVDYFDHFYTNVDFMGRSDFNASDVFNATNYFNEHPDIKNKMVQILRGLDLGLNDLVIEKHKVFIKEGKEDEIEMPFGVHTSGSLEVRVPLFHESSGTQRSFVLLRKMLPALESGGVVILDEMEADLHPDMLIAFLELFINAETNPFDAQIVFTCHGHEVLNLLDKTQVVLIEKDEACASEAWRLDEMKGIRRDDNLYAKYKAGAYGAIPNI